MRARAIAAVLAIAWAACVPNPAKRCVTSSDCGTGTTCQSGFCVAPESLGDGGGGSGGGMGGGAGGGGGGGGGSAVSTLGFVKPGLGSRTASATVEVEAQLFLATGIAPLSIELVTTAPDAGVSTSPLPRAGGTYAATVATAAEGQWSFEARFADAGLSTGARTVVVDRTGPSWAVQVESAPQRDGGSAPLSFDPSFPAGYFRRDETAQVQVSWASAETDVDPSSLRLSFAGHEEAIRDGGCTLTCGAGRSCECFVVDFGKPALKAFRDTWRLAVSGKDLAGNIAVADGGSVNVSRWKWKRGLGAQLLATPAISLAGDIVVGTHKFPTEGQVVALTAAGTERWHVDTGGVLASPVIVRNDAGTEYVVAGHIDGAQTPTVVARFVVDGGFTSLSCGATGVNNTTFASPIALGAVGNVTVGVFHNGSGKFWAFNPDLNDCASSSALANAPTNAGAINLVTQGGKIWMPETTGRINTASWNGTAWSGASALSPVLTGVAIHSLALTTLQGGGTVVVGGGGGPGLGYVFQLAPGGASVDWKYPASGGMPAWGPAIARSNVVIASLEGGPILQAASPSSGDAGFVSMSAVSHGTPLLGRDGRIYVADTAGKFSVYSPALVEEWSEPGFSPIEASPTIDCNREKPGQGSVAYLASTNGSLYAFIVDSRGIDISAPWPKYAHDPRNSGNLDTALSEFDCVAKGF